MTEVIGVVSGGGWRQFSGVTGESSRTRLEEIVPPTILALTVKSVIAEVGKKLVERWKSFPGCPQWPRWCRWSKLQKTNDDTLINLILILMISPTFNEVNCIDYFTRTLSIAFMTCYHAHKSHYTLYFT